MPTQTPLPALSEGERLEVREVRELEKETKPPARYTQGGLIAEMDEKELARNQALMARIRAALNDDSRRIILEIKHALLTSEGRTPMLSGLRIYEAVLFRGLRTVEQVRPYLKSRGVAGV